MVGKGRAVRVLLLGAALMVAGYGAGSDPAPGEASMPEDAIIGPAWPDPSAIPAEAEPPAVFPDDPSALSTSGPAGSDTGDYWTPARMDGAVAEMPTQDK